MKTLTPTAQLPHTAVAPITKMTSGWRELVCKEDWWAVWLGLGLVLASWALVSQGANLKWLAVTPAKWATADQLGADFASKAPRYLVQLGFWLVAFSLAVWAVGIRLRHFVPAFLCVYAAALAIFTLGQWNEASAYQLEPPLVALLAGLAISNLVRLPAWMDAGFRVEFYIKTGIVLLGATLPLSLILWAGPIAILQASIVSVVTFGAIYGAARFLGLDKRFAATLGVGGAVCGVSASIAAAGAVGARREDTSVAITTVIIWALAMIFILPLAARSMGLHTAVAGAWIGTSEFADAAGFAAAEAYGRLAGKVPGIAGTADQTVWAFTLMKVVGRDVWIGIWTFILAIVATTFWDTKETGRRADPGEIWRRFPKFVFGFIAASLIVSFATRGLTLTDYNKLAAPNLVAPLKDLRSWAFIFCFFSIGLTTRFRDLANAGIRPFAAFTFGVAVNVALGLFLSVVVFAPYWENLTR